MVLTLIKSGYVTAREYYAIEQKVRNPQLLHVLRMRLHQLFRKTYPLSLLSFGGSHIKGTHGSATLPQLLLPKVCSTDCEGVK